MFHPDTDFLVYALGRRGPEQERWIELATDDAEVRVSAIVWYELCRGPRTPLELALAAQILGDDAVVPFDRRLAERAADLFRAMGSPRRRGHDIAVAATAIAEGATLLTRNAKDFRGIDGLKLEVVR